jgi:nitrogen regulatory protein PII
MMKLIVVTAIREFESEIKKSLLDSGIKSFSHTHVTGYRHSSLEAVSTNWFASEMDETESVIFYAIAPDENANIVFSRIQMYNESVGTRSKVHIVILNTEKSN